MRFSSRFLAAAAATSFAVAGCQSPAGGSAAIAPLDIERMIALLPEGLVATYDASDFDAASGTNTLTNFRISAEDAPDVGVGIEELKIWGFRPEAMEARLEGTNLADTSRVLERLEANGVAMFGIDALYEDVTNAYVDVLGEAAEDFAGAGDTDLSEALGDAIALNDFTVGANRLVVEALDLRPYERAAPSPEPAAYSEDVAGAFDTLIQSLQGFVAFNRAIGADTVSVEGLTYNLDMNLDGDVLQMAFAAPLMRIDDWQGGDVGRVAMENMSFSLAAPIPEEDRQEGFPLEQIDMSGTIGSYSIEGMQLDKAYRYLAFGEMPPRTETDLMSLGVWRTENMSYSMFGAPFYSLESAVTEWSEFHWLIPTRVTSRMDNLVYDIGSLIENVAVLDPEFQTDEDLQSVLNAIPVLETYGLAAPSIDGEISWNWQPEDGPADLSLAYGLDGYGALSTQFGAVLPAFSAMAERLEAVPEGKRADVFGSLMEQAFAVSGASLVMEDEGGLDKIFALAIDIAEQLPDGSGPDVSGMTPEALRGLAVGGISFGSIQAAQIFPPAAEYAASLAQYIQSGGTFRVDLSPDTPLSTKDLAKLQRLAENPEALVERLGLAVTHQPPAE